MTSRGLKIALIVGGIVLAVVLVLSIVPGLIGGRQGGGWGYYGWMGPGMMGGYGGMFLMPVFGIVVLGLIVWAVVAAVQHPHESVSSGQSSESALEILKRRYARGDIGKQEFEDKKRDLA